MYVVLVVPDIKVSFEFYGYSNTNTIYGEKEYVYGKD